MMAHNYLNAALRRSQRDALTQVDIDWPDSRGLLERLARGLAEREPVAAALQARVHAIAVAPEHAVLAQALTADQRRILGGRLRAVLPASGRVESAAGTPDA